MKKFIVILLTLLPLCPLLAQTGSEIILFDLTMEQGRPSLSNPVNITRHKGYDNQPHFHPNKPLIYFSSFNDSGRSDIKYYNYKTNQLSHLTQTAEREYSPTVTPDHRFISCIIQRDNGAQDLGKYPVRGGKPLVIIHSLTVGYHAWAGRTRILLFVLDGNESNSLRLYDLKTGRDTILAKNIGRSLQAIPGENAMSFVQKTSEGNMIRRLTLTDLVIEDIVGTVGKQDHLCWLNKDIIVMSEGDKLYYCNRTDTLRWQEVKIEFDEKVPVKGITRLAANTALNKLALVVSE